MRSREATPILSLCAILTCGLVAGGCDWFSTMSRTEAIQPHETAPLPPPEHAVPVDGHPEFDLTTVEGLISNPMPANAASVQRGEAWFQTFCVVCHGADGLGKGPISDKFPAIPPVAGAVRFSDAYLFGLITQGRGLMPGYARMPAPARWDVVNYLRSMDFGSGVTTTPATTGGAAGSPGGTAP
jgi:mono/diheme cytochrome c family protein